MKTSELIRQIKRQLPKKRISKALAREINLKGGFMANANILGLQQLVSIYFEDGKYVAEISSIDPPNWKHCDKSLSNLILYLTKRFQNADIVSALINAGF